MKKRIHNVIFLNIERRTAVIIRLDLHAYDDSGIKKDYIVIFHMELGSICRLNVKVTIQFHRCSCGNDRNDWVIVAIKNATNVTMLHAKVFLLSLAKKFTWKALELQII